MTEKDEEKTPNDNGQSHEQLLADCYSKGSKAPQSVSINSILGAFFWQLAAIGQRTSPIIE